MSRPGLPSQRAMIRAVVAAKSRLGPHFLRLTVELPEDADFRYQGRDQLVRLFFPRPGQTELRMPTAAHSGWMAQTLLMPSGVRPHVRNYTVRAYRPEQRELDIDFVLHGDGPAATWISGAALGDEVGLFDEGTMYSIREEAAWQLVVADETAVPAALAIAEQTPDALPTSLYLEVPHADDRLPVDVGSHVNVQWLVRSDDRLPGRAAGDAAARAALPAGRASIFIAGESGFVTGLRRHLVTTGGIAKPDVTFFGYWKHGRASLG